MMCTATLVFASLFDKNMEVKATLLGMCNSMYYKAQCYQDDTNRYFQATVISDPNLCSNTPPAQAVMCSVISIFRMFGRAISFPPPPKATCSHSHALSDSIFGMLARAVVSNV